MDKNLRRMTLECGDRRLFSISSPDSMLHVTLNSPDKNCIFRDHGVRVRTQAVT